MVTIHNNRTLTKTGANNRHQKKIKITKKHLENWFLKESMFFCGSENTIDKRLYDPALCKMLTGECYMSSAL